MQNLKESILEKVEGKIKSKNIKMKPKWYFIFKSILVISFFCILFLATIYIGNFILLIFHEHKEVFDSLNINPFNFFRIMEFVKTIPMLLFLLVIVFIFSLYKLIKDYAFVYRNNFLYVTLILILAILFIVINIHIFLDKDFRAAKFGERGELPFIRYLHSYYRPDFMLKDMNLPDADLHNKDIIFENINFSSSSNIIKN